MDRFIEALSKADWTVLLTIILGLLVLLWRETAKSKNLVAKIDGLEKAILEKHENLGSDVSGDYKNLGTKISSEHMTIKKDTKSVYDMMLEEKQNRAALYENTTEAKKILDTIDIMREVVQKNAILNQEVSQLQLENQQLLIDKQSANSHFNNKFLAALKSFENKLSQFESYRETEEIRTQLKTIENQIAEYMN